MTEIMTELESIFHFSSDGSGHSLRVHVDNAEDIKGVRTQEIEPPHLTTMGFVLPPAGPLTPQADYNQNVPTQILQLDPLRKRAVVSINGTGSCFLCSSQAQAQSLQFGPTQNADEGAQFTAPFAFTVEATGPMWAVLATTAVIGTGAPTFATATGASDATTTLTIPSAGAGLADTLTELNYVFSAAITQASTLTVTSGGDTLYETVVPTGATAASIPTPLTGLQGQTIVITLTAGGTGITSTLNALYTQQTSTPGAVTIGVVQERRDH